MSFAVKRPGWSRLATTTRFKRLASCAAPVPLRGLFVVWESWWDCSRTPVAFQEAPSNNPRLVSYQRPELAALAPLLKRAKDCWDLLPRDTSEETGSGILKSARARYLPKEPGEPQDAYLGRIGRSSYPSTYRDAIRSFAGLLSRFQVSEAPASLEAAEKDVDMRDRKSTRLNSSHSQQSRMPSSA